MQMPFAINPKLDLVLERTVDLSPEKIWQAWTTPEHARHWFCPRPWSLAECEMDVRPGGLFRTVMRSPEGELMPGGDGCFLKVLPNRRLVWTSALGANFRPALACDEGLSFTAYVLMEPNGAGSDYMAIAAHGDEASRAKHEEMGFKEGWSIALDQLVEYMKT